MIVRNLTRDTTLGEAIQVADTAVRRVKGLLGRECLEDGQGLLFKSCSSLHTLFMRFPIDIIFMDRQGKVLKVRKGVKPFKFVAAPLRAYYALELPTDAVARSDTRVGDRLVFEDEVAEIAA
ncbi:MAG TPA: DUF192 domain-containing protein [Dehalococcoidia bacterium]|nr:DUF192 domain-containing protein [Dehalococcoidia bacterium]